MRRNAFVFASLSALTLAVLVLAHPLPTPNAVTLAEKNNAPEVLSLDGKWVGRFRIRQRASYIRIEAQGGPQGPIMHVLMIPGNPGSVTNLRVQNASVRFRVKTDSHEFRFDGELHGDTISGSVGEAANRGTFELKRLAKLDSSLYDRYSGAYDLGQHRVVYIRRADQLNMDPPSSVEKSWLYFVEESG